MPWSENGEINARYVYSSGLLDCVGICRRILVSGLDRHPNRRPWRNAHS
jgi:hypothetical protein